VNRQQELAAALLVELRANLCVAEERQRLADEEVKLLRVQIGTLEPLASASTPGREEPVASVLPVALPESEPRTILLRAKHTADLVLMFLRDHPGAMVPELHAMMVKEGLSVGLPEYFYTVIKKLEKKGLVRKDPSSGFRKGRYYAVTPRTNLVLPAHREGVTQ
jgi:hypothetical protein